MCGLKVVEVKSLDDGTIDIDALRPLLDDTVAGIMMTNPNTLGLFETRIPEIAEMVHACGGLLYYDGANFNRCLARCARATWDSTSCTSTCTRRSPPRTGGGGPGSGAICVSKTLVPFLARPRLVETDGKLDWVDNSVDAGGSPSAVCIPSGGSSAWSCARGPT